MSFFIPSQKAISSRFLCLCNFQIPVEKLVKKRPHKELLEENFRNGFRFEFYLASLYYVNERKLDTISLEYMVRNNCLIKFKKSLKIFFIPELALRENNLYFHASYSFLWKSQEESVNWVMHTNCWKNSTSPLKFS